MIRISAGSQIKRYADIYGCNVDEVVQWMNAYVNGPWADGQVVEKTEQERLDSIRGYISAMIKCSTYGRIKQALEEIKNEKS